MTVEKLPKGLQKAVEEATLRIEGMLEAKGLKPSEELPEMAGKGAVSGEAYVSANAILGLEKYLGMADPELRLAFFPSISLTNNSTVAKTFVRFDPALKEDIVIFGNGKAQGRELERVMKVVNKFRELTGITSKITYVSRNDFKGGDYGKGLGTSAAAGAALAMALVKAGAPELANNKRFLTTLARRLAGSATRSMVGGISIWLSHTGYLDRESESYGVRMDSPELVRKTKLVIIPIPQDSKTESAHKAAVNAPDYLEWVKLKVKNVPLLTEAILEKDADSAIAEIGKHAEADSDWLNKIIKTGNDAKRTPFDNWTKETRDIRELVIKLREGGLRCWYSMDTGPSVAVITHADDAEKVRQELDSAFNGRHAGKVFVADVAGAPEVKELSKKSELLTGEVVELLEENGISV